ncbi:hypothetical protein [Legionella sp.]|uniref:hypothetical protein n=1 Tax=Legionella sp. TaxID=459 RepID=UPI000CBEDAA2|nr:hypothetical protein [Legionella sp.]PJE07037.1 MAG: hypothetical protein CK430_14465 [Legionella sp.]
MQLLDIFNYIKDNISPRLKSPYVSVEYSEDDKEALLTGLQVALRNTEEKELTSDQIIDVFNAMMPKLRANMKLPTRKGSVAFKQSRGEMSEQGIVELLE